MSKLIAWLASPFPDATPIWAPAAAYAMCLAVLLITLAGLFPSIPERLAHIEYAEAMRGLGGSVVRRRCAAGGRHHESPAPALAEDAEAAGDSDAAGTARLGA